jgi:glycosyltransferase involved in cell wall biosynthesis
VLHFQGYTNTLLFAVEWAHSRKIPIIYEEHSTPDPRFDKWVGFQESINKATVVVAVSEKSAQALRTVCGITAPIVTRNPMIPDPNASGWSRQVRAHQAGESICVTTIARLGAEKGLTYLLEAIVLVKEMYPNTQFRVYGSGELRQDLLSYADRLGLDGPAIFVGPYTSRAELSRIMAETDIFVLSSINEGQPLAVVEAMSYGCPIVTTAVGGIPEFIEDHVNGLLCMPQDAQSLAEKICALIADSALRQRLGEAARHSYEVGPFQPAAVSNHILSIYSKALDARSQ